MRFLRRLFARFALTSLPAPGPNLDPDLHDLKHRLGPMLELLERAPVGVMVVGCDLRLLYANAYQIRMHGYSREELMALSLPNLVAPEWRANIPARLAQMRAKGGGTFDSWHLNKAGEPLHLSIMAMPIVWDGEEAVISVHANLTELDRSNAALEAAVKERSELMQKHLEAQKLEAIGSLAGGVAHDFNNLLSVILGYAEVLKGGLEEGGPQQEQLQEIEKAAAAAAELTQQLLAFGRKQVLRPVPLDLNRSVADVEKMLRRVLGENIRIDLRPAPGLGLALADPGQVIQVLMNLMINARDAMPGGGLLRVSTANVELSAEEAARYHGLQAGPHVSVEVADSGTGMDAATKARIWEPFFTTKGQGKGTGLGLPTVYGIVKQSRGDIQVESSPGQGSRFCVLLPRAAEAPRGGLAGAGERLPLGQGERVLLVEDERPLRGLITRQLEASGYQVLVAEDAESAVALADSTVAGIDVLLTDVLMPGRNGVWLADALSQRNSRLKVLFMSGYADDALQELGEAKRNLVFLGKPFNLRGLALKLREALEGPHFRA